LGAGPLKLTRQPLPNVQLLFWSWAKLEVPDKINIQDCIIKKICEKLTQANDFMN
jgi:hypothetical protein